MTTKPLARWTIGNAASAGHRCLRAAIKSWQKLYGDTFDLAVCHNNTPASLLDDLDVRLVNQVKAGHGLALPPPEGNNPAWKMYPARINPAGHEIVMDNDLILHSKLPAVDELLKNNRPFVTEAIKRNYGLLDGVVADGGRPVNTGMFGLPPDFDLEALINGVTSDHKITAWKNYFDEQGVLAKVFTDFGFGRVGLEEIPVLFEELPYRMGRYGMHFVGLNKNYSEKWKIYRNSFISI